MKDKIRGFKKSFVFHSVNEGQNERVHEGFCLS
jgi:hypothetical protein